MKPEILYRQSFKIKGGDFVNAGQVSIQIKKILKEIGLNQEIIYRVAICSYEAEMNAIMYAEKADVELTITPEEIKIIMTDEGRGIENIELALREGYSTATNEMREMGFGAGMGLPNMKRNSDLLNISSTPGEGTVVELITYIKPNG